MKGSLLLYNLKLNCLIFSTVLNSSLIIFIRTYTVNCRNALDRLHVHTNIILFHMFSLLLDSLYHCKEIWLFLCIIIMHLILKNVKRVYTSSWETCLNAMGCHLPNGVTPPNTCESFLL